MSEAAELDQLRIPFEKIKFGKEIEFHGYGSVFQGEVHDRQVALKRLNITNLGHIKPRLLAEILTISRFRHHPNLVALLGFCDEKSNEIILVYEYVAHGSLADRMRKHLTTIQRLEICLGAARGLDYLHKGVDPATPGIIHGDVKPSKILLNLNADPDSTLPKFEAKVSNFGLSKVRPGHVRESVGPTPEYRDPHYEVTGNVTKESDVYSLGVLLLEVLCGVPELVDTDDYQERHVTELVPKRLEQNKLRKIVHFDIRNEIKTECLETYAKIACQCVMKNPEDRPTMAQVVEQLEEALRLQGGNVPYVHLGSGVAVENVVEDDQKEDGNSVAMDSNTPEANVVIIERNDDDLNSNDNLDFVEEKKDDEDEECINCDSSDSSDHLIEKKKEDDEITKKEQSSPVLDLGSEDGDGVLDGTHVGDARKENENIVVMSGNDFESVSNQTPVEDVQNEPDSTEELINDDNVSNRTHVEDAQNDLESIEEMINGDGVSNGAYVEDAQNDPESREEIVNATSVEGPKNEPESTEETADDLNSNTKLNFIDENISSSESHDDQQKKADTTVEVQNSEKKPETIVTIREESFEHFVSNDKLKPIEKTEEIDFKRSHSTSSESSNGANTTPSDSLLQNKSPTRESTTEKTTNGSTNCCSMCASWKRFFSDSVKMLQNCFVRRAILE